MITNQKTKWNSVPANDNKKGKAAFDWWLFSFIAIVIILLVTMLSIT